MTNFSVVTYSRTTEIFCESNVFTENQKFSFTSDYNFSEFCGFKLYDDNPKPSSDKRKNIKLIVLCCVFSAIVVALVAIIIWIRKKRNSHENHLNSEPFFDNYSN